MTKRELQRWRRKQRGHMHKYIKVPRPVTLINSITRKPLKRADPDQDSAASSVLACTACGAQAVRDITIIDWVLTFREWLFERVMASDVFKKGGLSTVVALNAIGTAFDNAAEDDEVRLDVAHAKLLGDALKDLPIDPRIDRQIGTFYMAIEGATTEPRA